ncbi:cytochrome c oxidase assembly protein COX20, mitochondrial-like isoform X2 [Glandiceps talaboti]
MYIQRFFIFKVPCSRTAFLSGIGGGLIGGFAHFMFTSRVKRSADVGMISFTAFTLGSWLYCRYDRAKKRQAQKKIKESFGYMKLEKVNATVSTLPENMDNKPIST